MRLGMMQPYFFPYLGYYQGILAVDKYILYDNLNYIKEGWMNKNRYLVVDQKPTYFIVRVKEKSSYKKINEIELVEGEYWRKKILKSIFYNYKNSPFFDEVYPIVEGVVKAPVRYLTNLNAKSIIAVCKYLDIETEIVTDTKKYCHLENRLKHGDKNVSSRFPSIQLEKSEEKVIRIIEVCHREGADTFINTVAGQDLYEKKEFEKNGIDLFFLKTKDFRYPQLADQFYPNLSIIDVLMNCGKEGTKELLREHILK